MDRGAWQGRHDLAIRTKQTIVYVNSKILIYHSPISSLVAISLFSISLFLINLYGNLGGAGGEGGGRGDRDGEHM